MKHKYISLLLCVSMAMSSFSPVAMAEEAYEEDIAMEEVLEDASIEEEELPVVEESVPAAEALGVDEISNDELFVDEEGLESTAPTVELNENEEQVAAAKAAAAEVVKLLEALPEPSATTTADRDKITNARAAYEALSATAKNDYVPRNLVKKLEDCERQLDKIDSDEAKGHELARQIKALPAPSEITLDDEPEIARLEGIRDSYTEDELANVGAENLKKLIDCRNKITQLKAMNQVQDYVDNEIGGLIADGEYDEAHQKEIDDIIKELQDKIKELTENGNPDGSPVTQEQIDELINQAKEEIGKVKTVHQLAAEAYEAKLKAYKVPANLVLSDEDKVKELRADFEALSDKAKEIVRAEYIRDGETYIERLVSLESKISELKEELATAKREAKDYVHHKAQITPEYYTESGINESYNGIDAMIESNRYRAAEAQKLDNIREEADEKIDDPALIDIKLVNQYRDEAVAKAKVVRDNERLTADEFEARVDAMGPVIDLSRSKADDVVALRKEYNSLPSYAKKYADTNKTPAGDTYKERLEALEARIDKMAQDDADAWKKIIDALPYPSDATLANEGAIQNARVQYDALTKEAKAKVANSDVKKLTDLEGKMVLEHQKEDILKEFNNYVSDKLAKTTYGDAELGQVNGIAEETRSAIKKATSQKDAKAAKELGIKKIEAVKTVAQQLKEAGIQTNFNRMKFRSTKQTNKQIYLRWNGVKGIDVFQLYGGKKNQPMKLLRQYDYKARSAKFGNLYEKTEYRYKLYACRVVDGEIIKIYSTPVIYATTKGGKYGTVVRVKVNKVGNKDTSKNTHTITVKVKKGKTAKIKAKEEITKNKKLKRRRKLKYEVTNKKVAKVTSSGKIKALKRGVSYIRVYSQAGTYRSIKIRVR